MFNSEIASLRSQRRQKDFFSDLIDYEFCGSGCTLIS